MTAAANRDGGAPGLARRRAECACRSGDGIRIFALMKAGVQAHRWSRLLFLYMGLLAASAKGPCVKGGCVEPSRVKTSCCERVNVASETQEASQLVRYSSPPNDSLSCLPPHNTHSAPPPSPRPPPLIKLASSTTHMVFGVSHAVAPRWSGVSLAAAATSSCPILPLSGTRASHYAERRSGEGRGRPWGFVAFLRFHAPKRGRTAKKRRLERNCRNTVQRHLQQPGQRQALLRLPMFSTTDSSRSQQPQ
ncbi:unnamed protein product [Pleuronectes platessa]|uniref:Uncharacterized protein n=1 Tax=Pleuronectes platessa TaxID=8262 RepID=A0A9N7U2M3_PLEPL|nr:unnamed protein product [Pleuronectes platessa]